MACPPPRREAAAGRLLQPGALAAWCLCAGLQALPAWAADPAPPAAAAGPAPTAASAPPAVAPATAPAAAPAAAASAPAPTASAAALQRSTALQPARRGDASARPTFLSADTLRLRPDLDADAQGHVAFRRRGTTIEADSLHYDSAEDLATARGQVRIGTPSARYSGPELQLRVERFEGYFLSPAFELTVLGSGGSASRIDFLDRDRAVVHDARYTSCPRDGGGTPDWLIQAREVKLDQEAGEGVASGAVLKFLGVPILGLPVLSFPLSDARKSGWLPPTFVPVSSRNGATVSVPYYWNIAPNRDATITPIVYSRLGPAVDAEFRYLGSSDGGRLGLTLLPQDRVADHSRMAWSFEHEGRWGSALHYRANLLRVSDDDYWKDFSGTLPTATPRLLSQSGSVERTLQLGWAEGSAYARVQHWQVLQTGTGSNLIDSPYQRDPQLGLQLQPRLGPDWEARLQTELNHFSLSDASASSSKPTGWRWHGTASASRRFGDAAMWLTPRLQLNAVGYQLDQLSLPSDRNARLVPTASLQAGMVLERRSVWFGREQRQTLEPRLLYVFTPYRDQSQYPLFDTAERDFNTVSIFAENAFTGVDRISDANLLTAGAQTRWVDAATGAETLRLGVAQRYRFASQRVTLDGTPQDLRFSDVLVDGSTSVFQPWQFDAALQYNPDSERILRSVVSARYAPGPYRTLSVGYRLSRGSSEQVELGWQWPVFRGTARPVGASSGCGGTLYTVGRVTYSLLDNRPTDTLLGLEYDTGCWIGRVVARRTATSSSESSTQLMLQLEFVGLSRLGANPLQTLKDNIPGYRLLREAGQTGSTAAASQTP